MIDRSYGIANLGSSPVTLPRGPRSAPVAAVSQFRHTMRFSDYPQVQSGAGGVINKGTFE